MSDKIRVRFAPSPTGHLHLGGARTALFNWLFARRNDGEFILRIEDTDVERSKDIFTKAIVDGLKWLGMDWNEGPEVGGNSGPYFQTERMEIYKQVILQLLESGKIYHCFCTAEELEQMRVRQAEEKAPIKYDGRCSKLPRSEVEKRLSGNEKHVLRLKIPNDENIEWNDLSKGKLSFSSDLLDDLVVVKSDGFPTYNFAVVVDDLKMRISHVIRGEDHISNTPKQILIYRALGEKIPEFAHIPMILGSDKTRMSKRHGATSVIDYKEMGYEPEALMNFLALLGWSSENGKEILTKEELVSAFELERVSTHGAVFNIEKLKWMNSEYIKNYKGEILLKKLLPWLQKVEGFPGDFSEKQLEKMVSLYRERIKTYDEIVGQIEWFFKDPDTYDSKGLEKLGNISDKKEICEALCQEIEKIGDFQDAVIEKSIRDFAVKIGKKVGEIVGLCRLALSGRTATPGLFEIISVLGKERTIKRLRSFMLRNL
ncbi:MAG: glutamate--tRNA ligase [Candidatus Riflebacteria bacterium]|nr:glutamate--tRNA ligase [Candidatus Riflebacteria bacterium]